MHIQVHYYAIMELWKHHSTRYYLAFHEHWEYWLHCFGTGHWVYRLSGHHLIHLDGSRKKPELKNNLKN
jgi:hypothetical protein